MEERSIDLLQLDGGCLVFDFTNTISTRKGPAFDYLKSYGDIMNWSRKTGILPPANENGSGVDTGQNPSHVDGSIVKALHAREILYQLFSAIAHEQIPGEAIVKQFNQLLSEALSRVELKIFKAEAVVDFSRSSDEPLLAIMKSAYDVLTTEKFNRIKECPACGWLFIDKTKNGKRRWCDMDVCGSKDKAKRYYQRKKHETGEDS
jgi:predicted RNA-binding Zn ribbon-like protein